jgi:7,8-dihydropterin-6-yl-methyl-4-(beta-D-ribofuranosyl)aminobenzene 5'-phosphate synthase
MPKRSSCRTATSTTPAASRVSRGLRPARHTADDPPFAWTRRRFAIPGSEWELPTLSPTALAAEGFALIERRVPSLLLDGSVLVTGEVDRVTDFELGMPPAHQAWDGAAWVPDRAVPDDQALVVNVRGKGLVIVTGCGHAGVVNIVRHAMRLTGVTSSPR